VAASEGERQREGKKKNSRIICSESNLPRWNAPVSLTMGKKKEEWGRKEEGIDESGCLLTVRGREKDSGLEW